MNASPLRWFSVALACVTLGSAAVVATPRALAGDGYRTVISCSPHTHDSDRDCFVGDLPAAIFTAKHKAHIRYKVCIRRPDGAQPCFRKRTGRAGKPSPVGFEVNIGTYRVRWYRHGRRLDTDRVHIHRGD